MRIRRSEPMRRTSSANVPSGMARLVELTSGTMTVSRLATDILGQLSPWSHQSPLLNKFVDAYDAGDVNKASSICRSVCKDANAGNPLIVNLVYMCIRDSRGNPKMDKPVNMAGRGVAVPGPIKTRVKNELHAIGLKRWPEIPIDQIFWALMKNRLMPLQEDGTRWSGMLMGGKSCGEPGAEEQRATFPLAMMHPHDEGEWLLTNTAVQLSWCLLEGSPGKFEIVVYMG